MSTSVLPSLAGLGFNIVRSPIWSNTNQFSISGKRTAIALWPYPRWQWEINHPFLRSSASLHEFQDLVGFFNSRQGSFDSFLYQDVDDNSVTLQAVGTGDGVTASFQLVRSFGGFVEPILAPHAISLVNVAASPETHYTFSTWSSSTPGLLTFDGGHIPTMGQAITVSFTYYFPCHFVDDSIDFNLFMNQLYEQKSIKFESLK